MINNIFPIEKYKLKSGNISFHCQQMFKIILMNLNYWKPPFSASDVQLTIIVVYFLNLMSPETLSWTIHLCCGFRFIKRDNDKANGIEFNWLVSCILNLELSCIHQYSETFIAKSNVLHAQNLHWKFSGELNSSP